MPTYSDYSKLCAKYSTGIKLPLPLICDTEEERRLIYLALMAAKARHYNDKPDAEMIELDKNIAG